MPKVLGFWDSNSEPFAAAAQVTAEEVLIWRAPEGVLAAEVGQQAESAAEAAVEKNVRKVRQTC